MSFSCCVHSLLSKSASDLFHVCVMQKLLRLNGPSVWQGSSSQQPRDHSTGLSREVAHRPRRQYSELPFHAPGRVNSSTAADLTDRAADRADSRPRQGLHPADTRAGAGRSRPRTAERQHTLSTNVDRHVERQPSTVRFEGLPQGGSSEARPDQRPSSRQHSRQKSRPV